MPQAGASKGAAIVDAMRKLELQLIGLLGTLLTGLICLTLL